MNTKSMKYRKLGNTGIVVSEIGFGAWGIGGTQHGAIAYGNTDDRESVSALLKAYEMGITFYDTSDFYGYGHSETIIGRTLKKVRKKVVLATKAGFVQPGGKQDFSLTYLRQAIEGSLQRLQTDYIDLYQLHNPSLQSLKEKEDILELLQSFVSQGKVRAVGLSARTPQEALYAARDLGFRVVQINFNLVDQRGLVDGLFSFAEENEVGMIARTPLCFGFLTESFLEGHIFEKGDHRKFLPPEQVKKWIEARQLFLNMIENRNEQTSAQFALRFCLSYPVISVAIPGMLNPGHVIENGEASLLGPLSTMERKRCEETYNNNTFFLGKYSALKEK